MLAVSQVPFKEQENIQVQFIALKVQILLHARDIGIIDVLLVKVFDH